MLRDSFHGILNSFWPIFLLSALAVSFFGSLLFAAVSFPAGYDWRHTVMSSLASPRENPHAFRIASYGMAVSGVFLSLLALYVRRPLRAYAPVWTFWARFFFVLGGILLTVSALITPGHHTFLGLAKAHAKLAQAAGVGFGLGMALDLPAILRLPVRHAWIRVTALILITVPMTLYLTCRIFLPIVESFLKASTQAALQRSILGSLAFWEWIGSTSVYLFVALTILLLGRQAGSPNEVRRSGQPL
jgi:hypothetical protein